VHVSGRAVKTELNMKKTARTLLGEFAAVIERIKKNPGAIVVPPNGSVVLEADDLFTEPLQKAFFREYLKGKVKKSLEQSCNITFERGDTKRVILQLHKHGPKQESSINLKNFPPDVQLLLDETWQPKESHPESLPPVVIVQLPQPGVVPVLPPPRQVPVLPPPRQVPVLPLPPPRQAVVDSSPPTTTSSPKPIKRKRGCESKKTLDQGTSTDRELACDLKKVQFTKKSKNAQKHVVSAVAKFVVNGIAGAMSNDISSDIKSSETSAIMKELSKRVLPKIKSRNLGSQTESVLEDLHEENDRLKSKLQQNEQLEREKNSLLDQREVDIATERRDLKRKLIEQQNQIKVIEKRGKSSIAQLKKQYGEEKKVCNV
jgi:hypothetical protein